MEYEKSYKVLNLIITGIPSIPQIGRLTLNTVWVLNLIITGIPSILVERIWFQNVNIVLNLIITGIPSIPLDFARVLNSWLFSSFFNPRNIWPKSRNLSTFLFFVLNIYYFFLKKNSKNY